MSTLRTLKKLLLGETWLLPLGLAAVLLAAALIVRPLAAHAWTHNGGLLLLAGVVGVLIASVARSVRR
jgi:succinate-acetate transporter protein